MFKEYILNSLFPKREVLDNIEIREENIENFSKKSKDLIDGVEENLEKEIKKHTLNNLERTLNFLFLIRTVDFALWQNRSATEGHKRAGKNYFYEDLRKALFEIYQKEKEPEKFLQGLDVESFRKIFGFTEALGISKLRLKLLKEKIKWLFREEKASFLNFLLKKKTPKDFCFSLLCFDDFKDYYDFQERRLYILKKAQLLYFACQMAKTQFGVEAENIDELTVFADNVLPAVLEEEKILKYKQSLKEKIKKGIKIEKGSLEEIGIRAKTILACEKIAEKLNVPSWKVDQFLWIGNRKRKLKLHKTFTYFY